MAMSISGAVLNGVGSSFLISRGKRSSVRSGAMKVGRNNVIIVPHRNKSWAPAAVKGDSDIDPKWLDDASQKASEYVKETGSAMGHLSANKGQEVKDHLERAKNYIAEIASEAMDSVAENAKRASEYVTEKGKETKDEAASISDKAKESAADMTKKTAKYVGDQATKAKEAILPPKSDV